MYGLGETSNSVKVVTFALYSLFFATVVKGLPGTWVGIVACLSLLWDAVVDPSVGYLTDGADAVSKRYRCMLAGALTLGAGLWAFFSPPQGLSQAALLIWLLAASFILRTAASMFNIPYYAIGVGLAQDYRERTSITAVRNIANAIGTLVTASLSAVIFFPDKIPGVDPKLDPKPYGSMGFTFGLIMTVTALIAFFGVLPARKMLESNAVPVRQAPRRFFAGMREALRIHSLRVLLISFSLVVIGMAVNGSLLIHYLRYYVEADGSAALGGSQGAFYGAGLLGTLFWLRVSNKWEKHRLYIFSAFATAALMLAGLALFGKGHPLGTGNVRPLLIGYGLAGFFGCVLWFLPPSMLADVADESELLTGKRPEGVLFGLLSLFRQLATGVAILLAGLLLDRFVHLVPGTTQQSGSTAYRIGIVYSVLPAALFTVAAIVMLSYRLNRSRVESIQDQLRLRRLALDVSGGNEWRQ